MHFLLGLLFLFIAAIIGAVNGQSEDLIRLIVGAFYIVAIIGILALLAYGGVVGLILLIVAIILIALTCNNNS